MKTKWKQELKIFTIYIVVSIALTSAPECVETIGFWATGIFIFWPALYILLECVKTYVKTIDNKQVMPGGIDLDYAMSEKEIKKLYKNWEDSFEAQQDKQL